MWNFSFVSYYEIRHSIVHQRRFCYLKCKTYICLESIKLHVECVGISAHSEQFVSYNGIRHIKVNYSDTSAKHPLMLRHH